ncbi:MAG: nucleotidyltransferase family protein [Oscillospiraceae bacterium]|nr:nucleotidyltransferase family protein [Oscillospiraceae bacterium]
MKVYGIVSEYNPFHNGHIYQIEQTKKETGATHIVAVMSGNFVQRGEPALLDKFKRAEIAVKNGVDLVIEMPVRYSLANAELFARSAVMILGALRCVDGISFGAEATVDELKKCADAARELATAENLRPLMEKGMSYPQALQQLIAYHYGPLVSEVLNDPNNILAVEYLKSISVLNLEDSLKPFAVKRFGAAHDSDEHSDTIASGSYIRKLIDDDEDISAFVPKETAEAVKEYDDKDLLCWFENFERILLYRLRVMSPQDLFTTPDLDQGLANRIFNAARQANSLEDLLDKIKAKPYTMARIKRVLFNALLGIKAEDLKIPPLFGRILALNDRGADILKLAGSLPENRFPIPFSSSLRDFIPKEEDRKDPRAQRNMRLASMTALSGDIYCLGSRAVRPSGMDFTTPITFNKIEGFVSELPADLKTTAHQGTAEEIEKARQKDREEFMARMASRIQETEGGGEGGDAPADTLIEEINTSASNEDTEE